ncbi:hypothetical protein HBO32_30260 [Pseudomonas nitroreducens]|uniref:hypothetical protein n=1 Tax=Pseudomonas nitroreducens TaxID=46680 RepID=UPI0014752D8C|nr:hypothetical protein [Pseudomonas nitroreducens]NMZ77383.1 hypothetical protein [Pseudomonas nitroreducens]
MISSRDGWLKPHIFKLSSRGGTDCFICYHRYPAGNQIGGVEGFGFSMPEAYFDWQKNGGKIWGSK